MSARVRLGLFGALTLSFAFVGAFGTDARGQAFEARHGRNLFVGPAPGQSIAARLDPARTGHTQRALPRSRLRVAWVSHVGGELAHDPLVRTDGRVVVVTQRGEAIELAEGDGSELSHSPPLNTTEVGAPALLVDGSVGFSTGRGDVVVVRGSSIRSTHLKSEIGEARTAALPMNDGGFAVAIGAELALVDSEAYVRTRGRVPEAIAHPLVPTADGIAAIGTSGRVWLWQPGREPVIAGSFGAPIDGAALRTRAGTLLAVLSDRTSLVELDVTQRVAVRRATSSQGWFVGPPAARGPLAYVNLWSAPRLFVLGLDRAGREQLRVALPGNTLTAVGDAGASEAPGVLGPLVDSEGGLAFLTADGRPGVVTPDAAVSTVGPVCGRALSLSHRGIERAVGLAPGGSPGEAAFVVACEGGTVAKILGNP